MKKLIVANWKMNPQSATEARRLFAAVSRTARRLKNVEIVICPPFPYLYTLHPTPYTLLGGQNIFWEQGGAYTGEVSPKMLKGLRASYVIIGHSERRQYFGETDEMVNKKVKAALGAGLKVILCVGETLAERKDGRTRQVLRRQLNKGLSQISNFEFRISKLRDRLAIAYEPVWAIGTGVAQGPQDANSAAEFIANAIGAKIRVLYGGSVNAENIAEYLKMPQINGALVGGASLVLKEFRAILAETERLC